jgi:hypothetical protein
MNKIVLFDQLVIDNLFKEITHNFIPVGVLVEDEWTDLVIKMVADFINSNVSRPTYMFFTPNENMSHIENGSGPFLVGSRVDTWILAMGMECPYTMIDYNLLHSTMVSTSHRLSIISPLG